MKKSIILFISSALIFSSCKKDNAKPSTNANSLSTPSALIKEETTEQFITRLYQDPQKVMNELPEKFDRDGIKVTWSPFTDDEIKNLDYIDKRDKLRAKIISLAPSNKQIPNEDKARIDDEYYDQNGTLVTDHAFRMVDKGKRLLKNIKTMHRKNLLEGKLDESPWSDDYWAIQKGIIAYRYGDSNNYGHTWADFFNYTVNNTVDDYIYNNQTDILSPSEKYDLLVGDSQLRLTQAMWEEGRYYYNEQGKVEPWMGICHGWAAASFMLPRPTKAITLNALNEDVNLTFYPSDIKALGSLLWANGTFPTKFVGRRCNVKNPHRDSNGRITSQECFDNNPGTWHMAIVNQIGVSKRSFVMDTTYDYEVWNQPVYSYSYRYFNPNTGKVSKNIDMAMIDMNTFTKDIFRKYRDPEATKIVGIEMTVRYIVETNPQQIKWDSPSRDAIQRVTYRYDLELNNRGAILGGEWYTNHHPDFMWLPSPKAEITSSYDSLVVGQWDDQSLKIPANWSSVAAESSDQSLPLTKVINKLFELSSK